MNKLFKNKEVSRALLIQIIISVIATVYIFTLNTLSWLYYPYAFCSAYNNTTYKYI